MQLICAPPTRWTLKTLCRSDCKLGAARASSYVELTRSTHVVPGAVQSCRSSGCQQKQQEGANARLHQSRSSANTVRSV